jgi:hypothetical protein
MWEYELFILSSQVISISRHTVWSVSVVDRYKVYQDIPSALFLQWTDTKYIKTYRVLCSCSGQIHAELSS